MIMTTFELEKREKLAGRKSSGKFVAYERKNNNFKAFNVKSSENEF